MGLSGILVALFFLIWFAFGAEAYSCWRPPQRLSLLLWRASRFSPLGRRPSWEARHNLWHSSFQFSSRRRVRQIDGGQQCWWWYSQVRSSPMGE
jgi:hypothetical protein